ncbi:PREDICTED: UPF0184 protein C9orf16 homolog [Miniopterus natalensis]|uniref:UPF0184 protein C9orf16 homolog n=1 Tax=Miniopterus natalensis TaxID=291302 RepID=UPI0007A6E172|nr:PREDICTED: UPF0184 protein C9orf16 homolog [Miniopterus natalensis]
MVGVKGVCEPWGDTRSWLSLPFLPEYAAINSMLDQINSCLDHLEEKNDHLHARLQELLESNRQTRLEFQQQLGEAPSDASP